MWSTEVFGKVSYFEDVEKVMKMKKGIKEQIKEIWRVQIMEIRGGKEGSSSSNLVCSVFILFNYNTIQYDTIQRNAIQCNAIQHNTMQYIVH